MLRSLRDLLFPPPATTIAERELQEAERLLLHYLSCLEISAAMAEAYTQRIARLKTVLGYDRNTNEQQVPADEHHSRVVQQRRTG